MNTGIGVCGSGVEYLPSMYKALGLMIPRKEREKINSQK
jgi:hypothetical protein